MAKMTESLKNYGSSLNYVGGHSRDYSLCSSVSLWLGQSIAVHHIGTKDTENFRFKSTHAK
ncbi:MAG: hypothetical protein STSR0001_02150 [Methanothrix sp.]